MGAQLAQPEEERELEGVDHAEDGDAAAALPLKEKREDAFA